MANESIIGITQLQNLISDIDTENKLIPCEIYVGVIVL